MDFEHDEQRNENFELQKWLEERYKLRTYNGSFFRKHLVTCNGNIPSCLRKIETFLAFKKFYPDYLMCGDIEEPDFAYFCKSVYSFYLPALTSDGCRIFLDKVTNDERLFDIGKIMRHFCMQTEIRCLETEPENGDIILFDCNKVNLLHFVIFIPYFMKALYLILMIYPLRLKLLVLINTGSFMQVALNSLKMLFPKEKRNLFFVYKSGTECFSKHVEPNCLPIEYGGNHYTLNELRDICYQNLLQNREWFTKANHEIENLRYENLGEWQTTFGRNGTFKILQLD